MSWMTEAEPDAKRQRPEGIDIAIVPRTVDIGNFTVHRALPAEKKQMVGPFIFWDQMGPGDFAAGRGVDVRPHPHIGLATLTYLFAGSLDHRDSLGNTLRIVPGDVNLMYAGAGIVHSERTGEDVRRQPSRLFGIQSWLAQPRIHEEGGPGFSHVEAEDITLFEDTGIRGRLILGQIENVVSPLPAQWQTLYADIELVRGAVLKLPEDVEERAVHIVHGRIDACSADFGEGRMVVFRPGSEAIVTAREKTRLMLLGGAPMDGPRYIWWNFVSSSVETIKIAAREWYNQKFPSIPGDDDEFIPLPDLPFPDDDS